MSSGVFPSFRRNFEIMFNSKLSFFVLFFGPLLLMFVTGAALQNSSLSSVVASIYYEGGNLEDNPVLNDLILRFEDNSFHVTMRDTLEDCKRDVLQSLSNVCIEIIELDPIDDFKDYVGSYERYEVRSHVDFSRSRIVWGIISSVQSVVDQESSGIVRSKSSDVREEFDSLSSSLDFIQSNVRDLTFSTVALKSMALKSEGGLEKIRAGTRNLEFKFNSLKITIQNVFSDLGVQVPQPILSEILSVEGEIENLNVLLSSQDIEGLSNLKNEAIFLNERVLRIESSLNGLNYKWKQLQNTNIDDFSMPIEHTYQSVEEQDGSASGVRLEFLDYLFPSFLVFFVIFVTLIFSSTLIFRERSSNAYIRNVVSNVGDLSFFFGNFISIVFVVLLQTLIIVFISLLFLRINLLNNIFILSLISFLCISLFSLFGIALGYMFKSQESTVIASVSLSLFFLIFLPFITAVETLPGFVSGLVGFLPSVVLESKLRQVIIFGVLPSFSSGEILSVIASFVLSAMVIFVSYKANKNKEI